MQISRFFSVARTYVHIRWDVREALDTQSLHNVTVKLLLHPIVHVYTFNCAANFVEKDKHTLVVW